MVTWETITNELGEDLGFRQALVSIFKKYEGQETDERDAYNRAIKVTVASFARHFGVAEQTFDRWVTGKDYKKIVPVVGTISTPTNPREALNISDRPHTTPTSTYVPPPLAERKAITAQTAEFLAPMKDAIKALRESGKDLSFIVATESLEEAVDCLKITIERDLPVEDNELQHLYDLVASVTTLLMEIELKKGNINNNDIHTL